MKFFFKSHNLSGFFIFYFVEQSYKLLSELEPHIIPNHIIIKMDRYLFLS